MVSGLVSGTLSVHTLNFVWAYLSWATELVRWLVDRAELLAEWVMSRALATWQELVEDGGDQV